MKIRAGEVAEGDMISFYYDVWRGFNEWTPVKTGYREVLSAVPGEAVPTDVVITFRDSTSRVFDEDDIVELKQDWDKVE